MASRPELLEFFRPIQIASGHNHGLFYDLRSSIAAPIPWTPGFLSSLLLYSESCCFGLAFTLVGSRSCGLTSSGWNYLRSIRKIPAKYAPPHIKYKKHRIELSNWRSE